MMDHPVLNAIRREGFTPLGWFEARPTDQIPKGARFVVLVGNAGPEMFRRFARARASSGDGLDDWTREAIGRLARATDAWPVFPFDRPPPPILAWARRGGAGHVSPLGLNIHATYGLWHAYRAALLFPVAFDLPVQTAGAHPCPACQDKPCLTACPVGAFDGASYDVDGCARHLGSDRGQACMTGGCLARHTCPIGQAFAYRPDQAGFHMQAFLAARQSPRDSNPGG